MGGSGQHPPKPKRIWVFQALLVLQLSAAVLKIALLVWVVIEVSAPAPFPVSLLLSALLAAALLLALQRLVPRPSVVAPALAVLWALHAAYGMVAAIGALPNILIVPWLAPKVVVLLLAGFAFFPRCTRAYLAGKPINPRDGEQVARIFE